MLRASARDQQAQAQLGTLGEDLGLGHLQQHPCRDRDGQCGPAGMGERAQRGGRRGQRGVRRTQAMPLRAHSTRPASQTHAEASQFCSFITHRPGTAKQQPAQAGRGELRAEKPSEMLSKGATILTLGKDSLQPMSPAGAPGALPPRPSAARAAGEAKVVVFWAALR